MDVADLKYFETVARLGSMNKAASELHTVQSNVTARIRALEGEIGVPLFVRHTRGVSLTPAGQRMLPYAGRMAKLLADARHAAMDDGPPGGALVLGTLETTAALRLSPVLSHFARRYPKVSLSLTTGTSASLTSDVVECRLDAAFVGGPLNHPDLHSQAVFREELVLVTPDTMPTIDAIQSTPDLKAIVFRRGCSYRQRLEGWFSEMGMVLATPMEFGALDTILACVAGGVGVTLLPRGVAQAASQRHALRLHALPPDKAYVETLFIRRQDAYPSSAMLAFLDAVTAMGATGKAG
ncbi:LysR family transcriptional regulator [Cupriavidus campinensis]|uniref:LysR substrate-binding domain-containing protein n=1 Tax=Cupriavidus campinensis TaxID=151783 RepID=A0AAE9L596_9BURK|nr:LysR family transcriptional regulator [Cupriavidus campinensis]URF07738.1 LysR substrate-binding domain-containing protein [Cupriavidus campinensis]